MPMPALNLVAALNPISEIETTDFTDDTDGKKLRSTRAGRFFPAGSDAALSHPCHPHYDL